MKVLTLNAELFLPSYAEDYLLEVLKSFFSFIPSIFEEWFAFDVTKFSK